ncbi:MAG: Ig-like domain-containing protein [Gemmatimonadota bacterium]
MRLRWLRAPVPGGTVGQTLYPCQVAMWKAIVPLFSAVALLLLAGCDSSKPAGPPPVATVVVAPLGESLQVGATVTLTAAARDAGGASLAGRTVSWQTTDASVATITAGGTLTAVGAGTVTVIATVEGRTGTLLVTVLPPPVATITVSASATTVTVGNVLPAFATTLSAGGATLAGRVVTWSTSNPLIATVDGNGGVTAIAAGNVNIIASSEGKTGTLAIVVAPVLDAPQIATIVPATVVAGGLATISGGGFDPAAASNSVTIRGVNAPIVSVTPTQLIVSVPCVQSGPAPVQVVTRGNASAAVQTQVTVTARTLAVGQSLVFTTNASSTCNELITASPTARYLVTVFSAGTTANTLVDFDFVGNAPPLAATAATAAGRMSASVVPVAVGSSAGVPVARSPEDMRAAAQDASHWAMLERDRVEYQRLLARASALGVSLSGSGRTSSAAARAISAPLPAVGDMRALFFTFSGGCQDVSRVIRGRAIYVGSRSIIWEDSANTLQSANDAPLADYYTRLGQIFDADQYESVKRNFGDPLLRDAVTDADERVHMVYSERLNGSGAAAYVTSCDQAPTSVSAGSNFGQFFYGSVPTTAGSNLANTAFPDGWFNFMARTVVHEVKHIASHSARVANGAGFEVSWLEEGTARHAEEMWVRESLHKTAWKANNVFGTAVTNGLYCDFLPADPTCLAADVLRRPSLGMRRHFNEIREKLLLPSNYSPYGDGTGQTGATFYQTAWSLVRYTIDRYASSDAAFYKALMNSNTNGIANLSGAAGVSIDQLIGGWGLTLYADDYPGLPTSNPDILFPSWNLRNIYSTLNQLPTWTGRFPTPFPLQPTQLAFGAFTRGVTGMRGGAHAYFELSGAALPQQVVGVRAPGGGVPSSLLRVAIVRLQ